MSLFIILDVYELVKILLSEYLCKWQPILARVDLMYKGWISNILTSHFIIYWIVPYHIQMINIWLYSWIELILYFWNVISCFLFIFIICLVWNNYFTILQLEDVIIRHFRYISIGKEFIICACVWKFVHFGWVYMCWLWMNIKYDV